MTETRDESQEREDPDARNRRILGVAALEVSGELGYRSLTAELIAERAGLTAEDLYSQFDDPFACYASGYETTVDHLADDLLGVAEDQASWVGGMGAGLSALGRFLETEPLLARGIFLEVYLARGSAEAKRNEVFERLSRVVDTARRENTSRHSPPPIAARFILNMIEAAATRWLRTHDPATFAEAIPDLLYVAATFYFGREEAERQIG